MVKYSATILFVTLAVFWSSTEASPHHYKDQLINELTEYALEKADELPEPDKTLITELVNKAKNRHWNSFQEYELYINEIFTADPNVHVHQSNQNHHGHGATHVKRSPTIAGVIGY